ncbi:hypothetical protein PSTT_05423 [Puccinia striiformis]|uniref:OTU domain-containing protein n=1 Tax=Puccinia striiformis TaxID=27350 RepID=A0A2S4VNQ3_9BASI|nr:hypothetical protein PSTT_05423 [Puccinia striiformis]
MFFSSRTSQLQHDSTLDQQKDGMDNAGACFGQLHHNSTLDHQESVMDKGEDCFGENIDDVSAADAEQSPHGPESGLDYDSSDGFPSVSSDRSSQLDLVDNFLQLDLFGDSVPGPMPAHPDEDEDEEKIDYQNTWSPFRSQEDFLGCLLMGYLHNIVSRSSYIYTRQVLSTRALHIPYWDSVQRTRARLRKLLNFDLMESISVFNNKCYAISLKGIIANELLNPYVTQHLEYYPHDPTGTPINSLCQSFKWREDLAREHRVQMVPKGSKHFYIFEPTGLASGDVVVPIFFYKHDLRLFAKCCLPEFRQKEDGSLYIIIPADIKFTGDLLTVDIEEFEDLYNEIEAEDGVKLSKLCGDVMFEDHLEGHNTLIPLPNPWRVRANGRIIRHVPITLYADDTSGNVSKQWNKHISYYFTLSGLHPHLSNQEYHCHFVGTSNVASVLELGEPIIDDLCDLGTIGHPAYDSLINENVLIMSVVLAFLADSPMHAEVTSTPLPGNANNPCRVCHLHVAHKDDKCDIGYVKDFLGITSGGHKLPPLRSWPETKARLLEMWKLAKTNSKDDYIKMGQQYGLKDNINTEIVNQYKQHKRPGQKERILKLEKDSPHRLLNCFFRIPSFDGCLDTPVEILHVFQLGPVKYLLADFMISTFKGKETLKLKLQGYWNSFNTEALNIPSLRPEYMVTHWKSFTGKEFKKVVQAAPFVFYPFMKPSMRDLWASLCSLATLIFQTEISNLNQYVADLEEAIEIFLYHHYHFKASSQVTNMFKHNREMQKVLGLDTSTPPCFPSLKVRKVPQEDKQPIPANLKKTYPYREFQQITSIKPNVHDSVKKGTYVLIRNKVKDYVGRVDSLWQPIIKGSLTMFYMKVTKYDSVRINSFYNMQEYQDTHQEDIANASDIICCLNFQHNCHDGNCLAAQGPPNRVGNQEGTSCVHHIKHSQYNGYILNSGALRATEHHRRLTGRVLKPITPEMWEETTSQGLAKWKSAFNAHSAPPPPPLEPELVTGHGTAGGDSPPPKHFARATKRSYQKKTPKNKQSIPSNEPPAWTTKGYQEEHSPISVSSTAQATPGCLSGQANHVDPTLLHVPVQGSIGPLVPVSQAQETSLPQFARPKRPIWGHSLNSQNFVSENPPPYPPASQIQNYLSGQPSSSARPNQYKSALPSHEPNHHRPLVGAYHHSGKIQRYISGHPSSSTRPTQYNSALPSHEPNTHRPLVGEYHRPGKIQKYISGQPSSSTRPTQYNSALPSHERNTHQPPMDGSRKSSQLKGVLMSEGIHNLLFNQSTQVLSEKLVTNTSSSSLDHSKRQMMMPEGQLIQQNSPDGTVVDGKRRMINSTEAIMTEGVEDQKFNQSRLVSAKKTFTTPSSNIQTHQSGAASPNHNSPEEIPHQIPRLPRFIQPFVQTIFDVDPDGNCGFRVVAYCLYGDQERYMDVRDRMVKELTKRQEFYLKEGIIFNINETLDAISLKSKGWCPPRNWLVMPSMGEIIANAFNTPVFFFSQVGTNERIGCQGMFPTFCPPNSNRPIFIALIDQHYGVLRMNNPSLFPMPQVLKNWYTAAEQAGQGAEDWAYIRYADCIEMTQG